MNINDMAAKGELNEPGQFLYSIYCNLKELAVKVHDETYSRQEIIIALAVLADTIEGEVTDV